MPKLCSACGSSLTKSDFAKNQWTKSDDTRRCKQCTEDGRESSLEVVQQAQAQASFPMNTDLAPLGDPRDDDPEGPPRLLPAKPSEDASGLLRTIRIPDEDPFTVTKSGKLVRSQAEWCLDVTFPKGLTLTYEQIAAVFKDCLPNPPLLVLAHGRLSEHKYWVPLEIGLIPNRGNEEDDGCGSNCEHEHGEGEDEGEGEDGEEEESSSGDMMQDSFDALCFSVCLAADCSQIPGLSETADEVGMKEVQDKLTLRAKTFKAKLAPRERLEDALARVDPMSELIEDFNGGVEIMLKSNGPSFDPVVLWDALSCLGLTFADQCFRWDSAEEDLFRVSTKCEPALDPETMAAGTWRNNCVAFSFYLPLTIVPLQVFDAMAAAAKYVQKRTGGKLVDEMGTSVDFKTMRTKVRKDASRLKDAGLPAGDIATFTIF